VFSLTSFVKGLDTDIAYVISIVSLTVSCFWSHVQTSRK